MSGPVLPPDLEEKLQLAVAAAEDALRRLDQARRDAEKAAREIREALEQQLEQTAAQWAPDRAAEAQKLAQRTVRIADEIVDWAVGRSPWGLADRLIPELRDGVGELRAFLDAKPLPESKSGPAPARPAP
ncbi:MAG TPA: hypothetical protein VGR28_12670 [Candidatus Thermoplasmatota archaeon]|jgi:ElaB/YqjD/DUF883 family membrane-anchored ribosome-binding protein|nr:hypothetical protein [Candidatus Thermoplasmatota archaeon]